MKKLISQIKELFAWLFSSRVGEAINNGASYEEVEQIVREEAVK